MSTTEDPVTGNWYRQHDDSRLFQVIAVDEGKDSIRIQYVDGDMKELDFASWKQLTLHHADPPAG